MRARARLHVCVFVCGERVWACAFVRVRVRVSVRVRVLVSVRCAVRVRCACACVFPLALSPCRSPDSGSTTRHSALRGRQEAIRRGSMHSGSETASAQPQTRAAARQGPGAFVYAPYHTNAHKRTYTHTRTHTHTYTRTCLCAHACKHTHKHR